MPNEPEHTAVQEETTPVEQEGTPKEGEAAGAGEENAEAQESETSEEESKPKRDWSKLIDVAVLALLALAVGIGIFIGVTTYSYLNEVATVRALQAQMEAAASQPRPSGHAYSGPGMEYIPNDWPSSNTLYDGPAAGNSSGTSQSQDSSRGQVVDSPGLSELTEPVDGEGSTGE